MKIIAQALAKAKEAEKMKADQLKKAAAEKQAKEKAA